MCVVTYRNGPERVAAAIRPQDILWVRDNTRDNIGFAAAANELAGLGADPLIALILVDARPSEAR